MIAICINGDGEIYMCDLDEEQVREYVVNGGFGDDAYYVSSPPDRSLQEVSQNTVVLIEGAIVTPIVVGKKCEGFRCGGADLRSAP